MIMDVRRPRTCSPTRIFIALAVALAPLSGADAARGAAGWSGAGTMVVNRSDQTATLLPGGKVLVAGGYDNQVGNVTPSTELYDPGGNGWTAGGSMAAGRAGHTATALADGKVLVAGGEAPGGGPGVTLLSSAELYDPVSAMWSGAANMAESRRGHSATLLPGGKVLIVGGTLASGASAVSAELYDPAAGSWSPTGDMATGRYSHTVTALPGGKVLVAGGFSGFGSGAVPTASAELYDPATGSWSPAGDLGAARGFHTATALNDGRVLVVGGIGGAGPHPPNEIYDPASDAWTAAGAASQRRFGHTAAALADGTVLIAGGAGQNSGPRADAEIYDPATATSRAAPSMSIGRAGPTATMLTNGKVLVAAGTRFSGGPSPATAELYGELPLPAECADTLDNDGDTVTDFPADPGCTAAGDEDETNLDDVAPGAELAGRLTQKLGRRVTVVVVCHSAVEDCIASAKGTLSIPGAAGVFRLGGVSGSVIPSGTRRKLRLRVPRKARGAARRALRRGQKVRAKLTVRVADAAGNTATLRRTVRVKR